MHSPISDSSLAFSIQFTVRNKNTFSDNSYNIEKYADITFFEWDLRLNVVLAVAADCRFTLLKHFYNILHFLKA